MQRVFQTLGRTNSAGRHFSFHQQGPQLAWIAKHLDSGNIPMAEFVDKMTGFTDKVGF